MKKPTLLKYLIAILIGAGISLAVMGARGIFAEERAVQVMAILSDAFFVSGIILTCVGLIIFAGNGGVFDMLAFSMVLFFSLFRKNLERKYKDFYEYREAKKGTKRSLAFLLIVGLCFIALAGVFLALYYTL